MKYRFTETRVVQDEHVGTARETRFEAGKVYDLGAASAAHWLARGVVEPLKSGSSGGRRRSRQKAT